MRLIGRVAWSTTLVATLVCTLQLQAKEKTLPVPPGKWIDVFGQNKTKDWPGKIHTYPELHQAEANEVKQLATVPALKDRDEYQAWKSGPTKKATGFFRLEKIDDRWWFIAPNGHLFYSTGIDCISCGHDTVLNDKNRESYTWLPSQPTAAREDGQLDFASTFDTKSFSMYRVNLIRKWGGAKVIDEKFRDRAFDRMRAWGFTTIGNWMDEKLNLSKKAQMPYVSMGPKTWELKIQYLDGDIPDVFDSKFESEAIRVCTQLKQTKDDPWLVGYFVDNEMPWWNIPYDVLMLDDKTPCRIAWVKKLQAKYKDIQALNKAWGTKAKSYTDLRWPGEKTTAEAESDMKAYMSDFAELFYKTWYKAMKLGDPNHLVLGSRIPYPMDEIALPCARNTDVISFNHYSVDLAADFKRYYDLTGKPMLIGEYDFDSLDAGLISAYVPVANQAERGAGFRYYTEQAASMPFMVGTHYFQYIDEPLTGRGDGERSFNGFVTVTDTVYPELAKAARASNELIYQIHSGKVKPAQHKPVSL